MQDKAQKHKQSNTVSKADGLRASRFPQKQVYNKPRVVCYGPLSKNIAQGFLSGAEADSTFAV